MRTSSDESPSSAARTKHYLTGIGSILEELRQREPVLKNSDDTGRDWTGPPNIRRDRRAEVPSSPVRVPWFNEKPVT